MGETLLRKKGMANHPFLCILLINPFQMSFNVVMKTHQRVMFSKGLTVNLCITEEVSDLNGCIFQRVRTVNSVFTDAVGI